MSWGRVVLGNSQHYFQEAINLSPVQGSRTLNLFEASGGVPSLALLQLEKVFGRHGPESF